MEHPEDVESDSGNRVLDYTSKTEPSALSIWLEQCAPCSGELAWCHSTDAYTLQRIIRRGELYAPTLCDVFGEYLSYFFYGRPAYRKRCEQSLRTTARAPVVILMSPDIIRSRKRVFPFDTGAFARRRYRPWVHEHMELCDFELTRLPDSPRRFVDSFYQNNYDYLTVQPRAPIRPYGDDYHVEALVAMLTDTDASSADDRRLALELQVDQPIPFRWPLVRGLILPRVLQTSPYLTSFLLGAGRGVDVRWFDLSLFKLATDYQALLERHALELQTHWRLL